MAMTDYRSYIPETWEKIMIFTGCVFSAAAAGILFYDTPVIILASFVLFIPALKLYEGHMASKRKTRLRSGFRDLLDSLSASFAGGRHMREALEEALNELKSIYGDDEEIVSEVREILKRINDGETDIAVLEDFDERVDLEDVSLFVQVYRACRETGGDLISAMSEASDILGDKIKIENEILEQAPKTREEIAPFIEKIIVPSRDFHSKEYRFMYQVFTSPAFLEQGKKFRNRQFLRYRKYAEEMEKVLNVSWYLILEWILYFEQAIIQYALWENSTMYVLQKIGLENMAMSMLERDGKPPFEKNWREFPKE